MVSPVVIRSKGVLSHVRVEHRGAIYVSILLGHGDIRRTFVVVLILESCGSSCGTEVSSILVADESRCHVLSIDLVLLLDDGSLRRRRPIPLL